MPTSIAEGAGTAAATTLEELGVSSLVEKSVGVKLLESVAASEPITRKLGAIREARWPVQFSHVIEPAQAFLAAVIAHACHGRPPDDRHAADSTIWVLCPSVHSQELLYESLLNWRPDALFLPEAELVAVENVLPDPEIAAERLALLMEIERDSGPRIIVATRASLDQPAPERGTLQSAVSQLRRGATAKMEQLLDQLVASGYERVAQVTTRGQFAVRGGIVDLYSWHASLPFRLEFFGDQIESLREFDIDSQTSVRDLASVAILLGAASPDRSFLFSDQSGFVRDYVAPNHLVIAIEPDMERGAPATPGSPAFAALRRGKLDVAPSNIQISEGWIQTGPEDFTGAFEDCDIGEFAAGDLALAEAKRAQFIQRLKEWRANNTRVVIYFQTEGENERFREIMAGATEGVDFVEGTLRRGFCFREANLVVLSAAELFGRFAVHARRHLRRAERNRAQIDFSELNEGDLVVHLEHGIGRFLGLIKIPRSTGFQPVGPAGVSSADSASKMLASPTDKMSVLQEEQEVLGLEFADEAKLYVPLEQAYLVSRYVGAGKKSPPLSSLGDGKWARAKIKAAASIFDYAGKMLAIQAERQMHPGYAFAPDTKWQAEFERSFPFRETPDQMKAIIDAKIDMERPRPMDRLICGDVGFGKTEVAVRAAFKAVMAGKQVAVLAPTTVLAQQHFEVFRQRMLDYPVRIEMLSRFRSQSEQKKVLQLLHEGGVDIVIGTHRLISGDVVFKDLGVAIIDEEQRFGVLHKEKFKELFKLVDVLTLSATPIPRTLYLSLVGVKDMSTIETPPLNRLPVETVVSAYDERIIRTAIDRELERQGQVFFLHNRVATIESARDRIVHLCPQARVEIGHGQMDADELEAVMARFIAGKTDVLVCTTIIESGLDIPNANTIIIDRADQFGLADLYQLRGRVGRAEHKAYAYLLLPREMMTIGAARKRISAIKQYSSLGAGFRIAMRDLEIRGAGSILGTAQSGHIVAVGFDLYCQLLKQAVTQLKGEKPRLRLDVDLQLDFVVTNEAEYVPATKTRSGGLQSAEALGKAPILERIPAFIPVAYVSDPALRIRAYRNVAEVTSQEQLDRLQRDWRDRFGPVPPAVDNLFALIKIKLAAAESGVSRVELRERKLMLTRHGDFILVAGKFPRLVAAKIDQYPREIQALIKKL
ncbi:MAG: transcription-repair coupling factor [Verrucomicrobia bacterium]|nr:MAG: transcription-repair coupling factor [Verrucomicrobiota bacterium]PYJ33437.1 MAG: transcription-repair coupling factor [Verrucomicrobiota bacterium]